VLLVSATLTRLTEPPLGEPEADESSGEVVERFEDVGPLLGLHHQPTEAGEPCQRALDMR
jgi:hypothetical protein